MSKKNAAKKRIGVKVARALRHAPRRARKLAAWKREMKEFNAFREQLWQKRKAGSLNSKPFQKFRPLP